MLFVIEPDVGMPHSEAKKFFKELLAGVVCFLFLSTGLCLNISVMIFYFLGIFT